MIIILDLFKVLTRAAKVIFVCRFRDPRGLLSREHDMFRRQTFEVWQQKGLRCWNVFVSARSTHYVEINFI